MKRQLLVISCWSIVIGYSFAQQVKWESRSYDFGLVNEWNSPPAVFKFTNTGKEKIMFLPMFYQRELYVEIPRGYIEPGESREVKIYFYTGETGAFNKSATVWIDKSNDPMELTVRGNIKSLYKNALTACPSFWNHKPDEEDKPQVVFIPKQTTAGYGLPEKFDSTRVDEGFNSNVNEQFDETEIVSNNINEQFDDDLTFQALTPAKVERAETLISDTAVTIIENTTELSRDKFGVNNIVFLIDESGSMKRDKKMEMLKAAIKELVKALRSEDMITIITYAASSEVLLPTTNADKKEEIYSLIDSLTPYGWTNGVSGMNTAYETVDAHFVADGNNQLFLATDGEFNQGTVTESSFTDMVKLNAAKGTKLSIVGFGQNEKAVKLMKKMADAGQGNFLQILPGSTDTDVLVEEIKRNSERR